MSAGTLYVAIKGDTKELVKALNKAKTTSVAYGKTAKKSFDPVNTSITNMQKGVVALGAAWASLQGLTALKRIADQYTNIDSKLRLVTTSTKEFSSTYQRLYKLSQDTGTNFATNAEAFTNLRLQIKDTGIATETTLELFENFNKALIVNGSTTQEAWGATLQFKQAMGSGLLAGEEFRGVVEGNTYWMTQLAKSMNMTIGELRDMSRAQELTTDIIIANSGKMTAQVDADFAVMTKTIVRSTNELSNALLGIVDDARKSAEGAGSVATSISDLASTVDENRDSIENIFSAIIDDASLVVGRVGDITEAVVGMFSVFSDAENTIGGPGAMDWGLIGYALFRGGPGAAGVMLALTTLNKHMEAYSLNVGSLIDSSKGFGESVQNIVDVITGKRFADDGSLTEDFFKIDPKNFQQIEYWGKATVDSVKNTSSEVIKIKADQFTEELKFSKKLLQEQKKAADKRSEFAKKEHEEFLQRQEDTNLHILSLNGIANAADTVEDSWMRLITLNDEYEESIKKVDAGLEEFFGDLDDGTHETTDKMAEYFDVFARDSEAVVRTVLGDGLRGEFDSIGEAFDSLLDRMLSAFLGMVAEIAAKEIFSAMFGGSGSTGIFGGSAGTAGAATGVLNKIPVVGKTLGKITTAFGFASGGVPGGLSAYRNSIVSSPTIFPFASGGVPNMGIMGEAGEEGILPLTQTPNGLGVHAIFSGGDNELTPTISENVDVTRENTSFLESSVEAVKDLFDGTEDNTSVTSKSISAIDSLTAEIAGIPGDLKSWGSGLVDRIGEKTRSVVETARSMSLGQWAGTAIATAISPPLGLLNYGYQTSRNKSINEGYNTLSDIGDFESGTSGFAEAAQGWSGSVASGGFGSSANGASEGGGYDSESGRGESEAGADRYASGGYHRGGWRVVGERGRELEFTGPSKILNNQDTEAILGGNQEIHLHCNVVLEGKTIKSFVDKFMVKKSERGNIGRVSYAAG